MEENQRYLAALRRRRQLQHLRGVGGGKRGRRTKGCGQKKQDWETGEWCHRGGAFHSAGTSLDTLRVAVLGLTERQ